LLLNLLHGQHDGWNGDRRPGQRVDGKNLRCRLGRQQRTATLRRSAFEAAWKTGDGSDVLQRRGRLERAGVLQRTGALERTRALQRASTLERAGTLQRTRALQRTSALERAGALQRTTTLLRATRLIGIATRRTRRQTLTGRTGNRRGTLQRTCALLRATRLDVARHRRLHGTSSLKRPRALLRTSVLQRTTALLRACALLRSRLCLRDLGADLRVGAHRPQQDRHRHETLRPECNFRHRTQPDRAPFGRHCHFFGGHTHLVRFEQLDSVPPKLVHKLANCTVEAKTSALLQARTGELRKTCQGPVTTQFMHELLRPSHGPGCNQNRHHNVATS
jgi:hypothetical protein